MALNLVLIWMATAGLSTAACEPREPAAGGLAGDGLVLEAFWEPVASSKYGLANTAALAALGHPEPAEPRREVDAASFADWLPPDGSRIGAIWNLPREPVLDVLRMFHPGATLQLFTGPGGTKATLVDVSDGRLEVLARIHAGMEFEHGRATFAQFEARLSWDLRERRARSFRLELPVRETNVDMHASNEGGMMAADIGTIPLMRICGGEPFDDSESLVAKLERARRALRIAYYSFASIDWLPLEEAVRVARERRRPLHVILLFGSLDDESC